MANSFPNYVGKLVEFLQRKKICGNDLQKIFQFTSEPGYSNVCLVTFNVDGVLFRAYGRSTCKERKKDAKSRAAREALIKLYRHFQKDNPAMRPSDFHLVKTDLSDDLIQSMSSIRQSPDESKAENENHEKEESDTLCNKTSAQNLNVQSDDSKCTVLANEETTVKNGNPNAINGSLNSTSEFGEDAVIATRNVLDYSDPVVISRINRFQNCLSRNKFSYIFSPQDQISNSSKNVMTNSDTSKSKNQNGDTRQMNSANIYSKAPGSSDPFSTRKSIDPRSKILNLENFITKKHPSNGQVDEENEPNQKTFGHLESKMENEPNQKTFGHLESKMENDFDLMNIDDLPDRSNDADLNNVAVYLKRNQKLAKKILNLNSSTTTSKDVINKLCRTLPKLKRKYIVDDNSDDYYVIIATISFEDELLHTFYQCSKSTDDAIEKAAGKLLEAMRLQYSD